MAPPSPLLGSEDYPILECDENLEYPVKGFEGIYSCQDAVRMYADALQLCRQTHSLPLQQNLTDAGAALNVLIKPFFLVYACADGF